MSGSGLKEGFKKIPSLLHEDWGFYPLSPFTVFSSKTSQWRISRSGFLTSGSSYSLRLPALSLSKGSGLSQVSSPITAAGPSPTLLT